MGWACRTRAATPAVCGVAIEVPDIRVLPLPEPASTDGTATPGAARSGFWAESSRRGPPELKPATLPRVADSVSTAVTASALSAVAGVAAR